MMKHRTRKNSSSRDQNEDLLKWHLLFRCLPKSTSSRKRISENKISTPLAETLQLNKQIPMCRSGIISDLILDPENRRTSSEKDDMECSKETYDSILRVKVRLWLTTLTLWLLRYSNLKPHCCVDFEFLNVYSVIRNWSLIKSNCS